jgi:photosystem II stability/assembly factor-like uncharacterized protein
MMKNYLLGLIILIGFSCALGQGNWTIIGRDLATILGGVSFISETEGWLSGAANGYGPVILYTNNSGLNWTQQNTQLDTLAFLAIEVNEDYNGIASGLGIVGLASGSAYTTDGHNWNTSKTNTYVAAFQSVGVAAENQTWQVGTWAPGDGNGFLTSTDNGLTDNKTNWATNALARYGSFPAGNLATAFLSGGDFPDTSANYDVPAGHSLYHIRHNLALAFSEEKTYKFIRPKYSGAQKAVKVNVNSRFAPRPPTPPPPPTVQWWAAVQSTFDQGTTWNTLFNQTSIDPLAGLYFNQISFTDNNNGWVVGQGQYDNGTSYGVIYSTTNGGQNWTDQLYVLNGEITDIEMTSATDGWAAGGVFPANGKGAFEGQFWQTTDGGNTWTPTGGDLKDFMALSISVAGDVVYAVGVNNLGLSSVAKYTPSQ